MTVLSIFFMDRCEWAFSWLHYFLYYGFSKSVCL